MSQIETADGLKGEKMGRMSILEMIVQGKYVNRGIESGSMNLAGTRWIAGTDTVYDFGNGIELRTHDETSWSLYVDGRYTSNKPFTNEQINQAFKGARARKVQLIS